ncbi:MAG TPA: hypothetical protein VGQ00_02830 [Candidatus Norongarragalinales archaeon]|jgi:hypothetical protein|nr:hypothetical protein [Candidatus Norongarragalinales archaeon]
MEEATALNDSDATFAAYNALSLLRIPDFFVEARFKPYAHVGGKAEVNRGERKIKIFYSDAMRASTPDVLTGFALSMFSRLFRRKLSPENPYARALKAFNAKASTAKLGHTLRKNRGRKLEAETLGKHYDLEEQSRKLLGEYNSVFQGVAVPEITWGWGHSKRRLAYHDSAFNRVVVSRAFDSPRVPEFVLQYLLYHEFLHAKHDVKYERGASLRRCVHTREFKTDEKAFAQYDEAESWIRHRL